MSCYDCLAIESVLRASKEELTVARTRIPNLDSHLVRQSACVLDDLMDGSEINSDPPAETANNKSSTAKYFLDPELAINTDGPAEKMCPFVRLPRLSHLHTRSL